MWPCTNGKWSCTVGSTIPPFGGLSDVVLSGRGNGEPAALAATTVTAEAAAAVAAQAAKAAEE